MAQVIPDSVKKAGEVQELTKEQIAEYMRCEQDPEYFVETYVKITDVDVGTVPFHMYPYQKDMLWNFHQHRFNIDLLSRQSGKCLTKDINITVRNKKTGEVYELPIGDFYRMCKDSQRDE